MDGSDFVDGFTETRAKALSPRDLKRALEPYTEANTKLGVIHVTMDFTLYAAALCGVLFLGPLWAKIVCSILAGIKLANLGTLGHEAAHGNVAVSPRLNAFLGTLCFLPCLYNYRLWVYDHHHIHHPRVNADQTNSWAPFSKAEFDALPAWRRALERHYRSSWGLGFATYNAVDRWAPYHVMPGKFLPKAFHASSWRHFALLVVYLVSFIGVLAAAPLYSNTGSVTAIVLGFVVPFYLWMMLFGFTVYVQHTDKRLPWFKKETNMAQEALSLHLEFPALLRALMHNVYEHAVHHVNVRVPYHRAAQAQQKLNELAPDTAVVQKFTFGWLHETLRDCRLYDYENHRWLDFDGKPTSPAHASAARHAAPRKKPARTKLATSA